MKIFDCHFHIDKGMDEYGIHSLRKNIIFNSIAQYREYSGTNPENDAITILFDYKNDLEFVLGLAEKRKIQGLKIHSRLQGIADTDYAGLFESFETIAGYGLPVIIDAFYYGHEYECQPNLKRIIEMAKRFPSTKFVIAHSGGIKVLEYFLHLKNLENVSFDLSFSLSYLKHASVFPDFKLLMRYGDRSRILFGTDFPFVSAVEQLKTFQSIAEELNIGESEIQQILFDNAEIIYPSIRQEP